MKQKIIRLTTADISLDGLLNGQLHFLNNQFEVIGIAADSGALRYIGEREGIRVIDVPMHRDISLLSDFKCLIRLVHIFRRERPFIVHANTPKGSLLSMVASKLVNVPHRLYLVTGLRYQGVTGFKRFLLQTMERITCACATRVIPEGYGVKEVLYGDNITHKPLDVIHNGNINGIDTEYYSCDAIPESKLKIRARLGIEDNSFTFIYVGRIVKDKGMNELAEAIRLLENDKLIFNLILVGRFESDLDPLAFGNEVFFRSDQCVKYVGYQKDVRPFLKAADALVFPSYREGFPNVVLQAGAMGLPAIVTDINGSNEIIVEGRNGTIIPPKDTMSLYESMRWFIYNERTVKSFASYSRERIHSLYEQKDVWAALLDMYNSL